MKKRKRAGFSGKHATIRKGKNGAVNEREEASDEGMFHLKREPAGQSVEIIAGNHQFAAGRHNNTFVSVPFLPGLTWRETDTRRRQRKRAGNLECILNAGIILVAQTQVALDRGRQQRKRSYPDGSALAAKFHR